MIINYILNYVKTMHAYYSAYPPSAIRESKVLTGRSLSCLAQRIEQGLTLAIYLGISDSTITGLGFDALARGQNLVDITYRILLLWKRRSYKLVDTSV